jgi:hypothetical protein
MIVLKTLYQILHEASLTGLDNPTKAAALQKIYRHTLDYTEKYCAENMLEKEAGYMKDPAVLNHILGGPLVFIESTAEVQGMRDQFSQYNFTSMAMMFDETVLGGNDIGACVFVLYRGDGGNFMAYVPKLVAESDQLFMVTLKEYETLEETEHADQ